MNRTVAVLPLLAGMWFGGNALAQDAQAAHCPVLPAAAGLAWEARAMGDSDFCRALRGDGSEAFGLYLSPEPSFEPDARNREESSRIDGRDVSWYRAEIATAPGVEARETLLPLGDGRSAHIWLQAASPEELAASYQVVEQLRFSRRAVAGN